MFKIAKILLASAVAFSAALPASAASTEFTETNSGILLNSKTEGELIATSANNNSHYVCINSGYLNVRNASGRVIGRVNKGQSVKVVTYDGSRYYIRYGNRYGWVSGRYICYGA